MCKFLVQGNQAREFILDSVVSENLKIEQVKNIKIVQASPSVSTSDILQKIRKLDEIASYFQEKSKSYLRIIKSQKKQIEDLTTENKHLKEKNEELEGILNKNQMLSKKYNDCLLEIETLKNNIENLEAEILKSKTKNSQLAHKDSIESDDKTLSQPARKSFSIFVFVILLKKKTKTCLFFPLYFIFLSLYN
jgi:hypothetical protein